MKNRPATVKKHFLILFTVIAGTTVGVFSVFLTGAMAPVISKSFPFTDTNLGIVVTIFFLSGAVFSAFFGRLADKKGGLIIMIAGISTCAVCLCAIAVLVHSWQELAVFLGLCGIANSAIQPAANHLLANTIPSKRQGTAFAIKQSAIPVTTLLAGLAVPSIALTIGWRWAFGVAGLVALVIAGITALAKKLYSFSHPSRMDPTDINQVGKTGQRGKHLLNKLPLWILALGAAFGAGAGVSLGTFIVRSCVAIHISTAQAGLVSATGSMVCLISRMGNGILADRRKGKHLTVVAMMLGGSCVGYILLATRISWLVIPAVAVAFGAGWGWNGLFNFAVVTSHQDIPGLATGITQTGVLIGSAAGPLIFGLVTTDTSYQTAWLVAAGFALIASTSIMIGRLLLKHVSAQ